MPAVTDDKDFLKGLDALPIDEFGKTHFGN
jgi:hypothetical protein